MHLLDPNKLATIWCIPYLNDDDDISYIETAQYWNNIGLEDIRIPGIGPVLHWHILEPGSIQYYQYRADEYWIFCDVFCFNSSSVRKSLEMSSIRLCWSLFYCIMQWCDTAWFNFLPTSDGNDSWSCGITFTNLGTEFFSEIRTYCQWVLATVASHNWPINYAAEFNKSYHSHNFAAVINVSRLLLRLRVTVQGDFKVGSKLQPYLDSTIEIV